MSYTFEQMMTGEGLPDQNFRRAISGKHGAVTDSEREKAIDEVKSRFAETYGVSADVVEAAGWGGGDFVCMAYRIAP